MSLGKLEKVDLRSVWANEATDFTPWLAKAENLEELSNTVGMELEVTAMEQFVGPFRADLLCKDAISQEAVLIENQLEKSNHTHLGQILTYAPGLNVRAIIWIASKFTEEHRAALDWLNEVTEENISFFGLEVELWKIGNSEPAPKFNIISRPNNWNKNLREVAQNSGSGEVSTTKLQQMKYWQALREYLLENNSNIRPQKASPQHWTNFSIGRSDFYMGARVNSRENYIAVYLNFRNLQSKEVFHAFHTDKEKIEKDFGRELVWDELPDAKECTIYTVLKNTDFRDEDNWQNQFSWIKESLESLDRSFRKRIRDLVLN
jgi:RNAse (barnase) inhibitor barstar